VLLSLIDVSTIQAQVLTYEEMVKKITVHLPEMNIKDSVFLQEIDSKIFNSGCSCLDYEDADVFNVKSKRQDDGSYYIILNPEKRNEPSCKNEVVQNLQKRSVQKSTSAQYKKSTEKTYFFGAFLLLCLLAISPKITNFKQ
jgi:hypothetical protein